MVDSPATSDRVVDHVEVTLSEAVAPSIDGGIEFDGPFPSRDHDAELIVWMSVLRDGTPVDGFDRRRFPSGGHAGKSVSLDNVTAMVTHDPAARFGPS